MNAKQAAQIFKHFALAMLGDILGRDDIPSSVIAKTCVRVQKFFTDGDIPERMLALVLNLTRVLHIRADDPARFKTATAIFNEMFNLAENELEIGRAHV